MTAEKWEKTNARRVDLIYKRADGATSPEEDVELEGLQLVAAEHLQKIAPLDLTVLERVEAELNAKGVTRD